jgi:hypothetical protein
LDCPNRNHSANCPPELQHFVLRLVESVRTRNSAVRASLRLRADWGLLPRETLTRVDLHSVFGHFNWQIMISEVKDRGRHI